MLTRLEAHHYRCFERLVVDIDAFQILVGANGSGKTTLLDLPVLIGELLQPNPVVNAFLSRRGAVPPRAGNLAELVFGGRGTRFQLVLEARLPPEIQAQITPPNAASPLSHLRYEIELTIEPNGELIVSGEYLFAFSQATPPYRDLPPGLSCMLGALPPQNGEKHIISRSTKVANLWREATSAESAHFAWANSAHGRQMLLLPRVIYEPETDFPAARWLHQLLTEETVFLQPDWVQLRQPSPPGLPKTIAGDGRNAPWLARTLQRSQAPAGADENYRSERFLDWIAHVQTALPRITDITVRVREDDRHAYFVVTYQGGVRVASSGLSDGTLRILTLTLLPYLDQSPTILVTEEPENGIHPRAIESVLQSLSSMYDSQVWVSSHSPVVLAKARLPELLCARLQEDGGVEVIPGSAHPRLADWRGGIDLGSLFAAGVLG